MQNVTRLCQTKNIVTVNGQYPGPRIIAREGDRLVIKVVNHVQNNISIHWYSTGKILNVKSINHWIFIWNITMLSFVSNFSGMELDNWGVDGQMGLLISHSVQSKQGNHMCTTLLWQANEEHYGGMLIFHGLELLSMVPLSFFPKDMTLTLSLILSRKSPSYWVFTLQTPHTQHKLHRAYLESTNFSSVQSHFSSTYWAKSQVEV